MEPKFKGIVVYFPPLPDGRDGETVKAESLNGLRSAVGELVADRIYEGWDGNVNVSVWCDGTRCPLFDFTSL